MTTNKQLRSFGILMFTVLGVIIPAIIWYKYNWEWQGSMSTLLGLGLALLTLGLFAPAVLKPIYDLWMKLALVLGYVMTRVIITLVFYLLMVPTGIIRRTFGTRDPLKMKLGKDTYWVKKEPVEDKSRYEKLY